MDIVKPTLLLNIERAKQNISRMVEKAYHQSVRFRPHFKTHQSATIGEWFREAGVTAITVSSVDMAQYFARHGWDDITIAFPVNLRQVDELNELARSIHLGLLVESVETVNYLTHHLTAPVDVWIEIDDGSNRTGIRWDNLERVFQLLTFSKDTNNFRVRGLLTHAGRIYHAASPVEIIKIYNETVRRMEFIQKYIAEQGLNLEISVGDTPGCTLCKNFGPVDEIRPGNFVLYDAMQLAMGVCKPRDIAALVACPLVAKYPERGEVIIYGGASHLSKDTVRVDGQNTFGLVATLKEEDVGLKNNPWFSVVKGGFVARVTQEHGVVYLPEPYLHRVKVGELIYIIPAHVCLTVSLLGEYYSADGQIIKTMNKEE